MEEVETIQWPKEKTTKGQTMNYKTLHRKLKIVQHQRYLQPGMNKGASEGW